MAKFLVTSALPYINGVKHLGNLVGSLLPADIYARFLRMNGHDVLAICGTDEHGTPAELSASEEGLPVKEYSAKYYRIQRDIYDRFGLSFDWFGRTSSQENRQITQRIFLRLWERGFIKERTISQFVCQDHNRFLPDRFIEGRCPKCGYERARGDQCEECTSVLDPTDLIEPRSTICGGKNLALKESRHLFLDLPKMSDRVQEWVTSHDNWPRTTVSIALKWLNEGLRERCITRDLKWGVPVPLKGYEDKVFYVWFDAPIGYIGISMEWAKQQGKPDMWRDYWKDESVKLVQFMAKDNIPFHTVTWPAVMMESDDGFILAHMIKGFQWLNYEGGKFSTSRNRGVFTDKALELFPADYWRYYLIKVAPERGDTDFLWGGFQEAVNKDLANVLGNFVNRTLALLNRHFDGIPQGLKDNSGPLEEAKSAQKEIGEMLSGCRFQAGVLRMRAFWRYCNRFIDETAPFKVVKTSKEEAGKILGECVRLMRAGAILSAPFIPHIAEGVYRNLGIEAGVHNEAWGNCCDWGEIPSRRVNPKPDILVTKIDDARIDELRGSFSGGGD